MKITRGIQCSVVMCLLCLFYGSSNAQNTSHQNYENNYAVWKNAQQQQDEKLKAKSAQANHYLSKPALQSSVNKISLNSATIDQLMQLSGVGQKKAEAIIEYRKKHGRFNSIDELQQVKGIGPALLNKNKAKLAL